MPPYSFLRLTLASDISSILTNIGIILLFIILAVLGLYIAKKWWAKQNETSGDEIGFSLGSLKRLHAEGKITDEELEIAKIHVQAQIRKIADRKKKDPLAKRNISLTEKMNLDHLNNVNNDDNDNPFQ